MESEDEQTDRSGDRSGAIRPCPSAMLRIAQLVTQLGDQLARIQRSTAGEAAEDAPAWFAEGEPVTVEMRSNGVGRAVVHWSDEGRIEVDFAQIGDAASREISLRHCARFVVSADARLCLGGVFHPAHIEEFSSGGMRLAFEGPVCVGAEVTVTPEDLAAIGGTVRWQQDGRLGIAFAEPFDLDRFTTWLEGRT